MLLAPYKPVGWLSGILCLWTILSKHGHQDATKLPYKQCEFPPSLVL